MIFLDYAVAEQVYLLLGLPYFYTSAMILLLLQIISWLAAQWGPALVMLRRVCLSVCRLTEVVSNEIGDYLKCDCL